MSYSHLLILNWLSSYDNRLLISIIQTTLWSTCIHTCWLPLSNQIFELEWHRGFARNNISYIIHAWFCFVCNVITGQVVTQSQYIQWTFLQIVWISEVTFFVGTHRLCSSLALVSQAIPFAERGRVWSRRHYRVVTEEQNYRALWLGNKMLTFAKHVVT